MAWIRIKDVMTGMHEAIRDDKMRKELMFEWLNILLALVSFFMTVVNVFTKEYILMVSTFIFSVACIINAVLIKRGTRVKRITYTIFVVETLALLALFIEVIRAQTQKQLLESERKYYYLYRHDALTGLYNRYGFNAVVDADYKNPGPGKVGMMILDIDDFKHINDRYVEEAEFRSGELVMKVTVSVGLCISNSMENVNVAMLVNKADQCLYMAKARGKNCVMSTEIP